MEIVECLWLDRFVDKIIWKHNIYPEEVEEVLSSKPTIQKVKKGDVKGEDLYIAFGKTNGGETPEYFVRSKERPTGLGYKRSGYDEQREEEIWERIKSSISKRTKRLRSGLNPLK